MDKLKEYIKNNRSQFDDAEPTNGHMERFANRLGSQKKQPKRTVRILITTVTGIAAAILIGLMIWPISQPGDSTCQLPQELAEVSSYYSMQREQEIDKIQQLVAHTDEDTKNEVLADIMNMREESDSFLHQICSSQMGESDSIPIVVKHYQSQIEALQSMVNLLEDRTVSV